MVLEKTITYVFLASPCAYKYIMVQTTSVICLRIRSAKIVLKDEKIIEIEMNKRKKREKATMEIKIL